MKTFIFLAGILLTLNLSVYSNEGSQNSNSSQTKVLGDFVIGCSNNMTELTAIWVDEFKKLEPNVTIRLSDLNDASKCNFCITSDENNIHDSQWEMLIGRNAIVPVINKSNKFLNVLNQHGISSTDLSRALSAEPNHDWISLIPEGSQAPLNVFVLDNEAIKSALREFTGLEGELSVNWVSNQSELIAAIQNDINSIGICSLKDIVKPNSTTLHDNIALLPIDKNGNGRLDRFENIYGSIEELMHGVWIGKYPRILSESIYAISDVKPVTESEVSFLSWIMSDGQRFLNEEGYINLTSSEEHAGLDKLNTVALPLTDQSQARTSGFNWLLVIGAVVVLIIAGLIIYTIIKMLTRGANETPGTIRITETLNESTVVAPDGLFYGKSHAWSYMEKDGTVKIGLDDFLQHITGQITKVKMKESGDVIRKGEKMLTISRNGKQLEIYAPVSGIIKEHNSSLYNDPAKVNHTPYAEGWVYTIIPKNWLRETEFMLFGDSYKTWLTDEFSRLKDFLANSVKINTNAYQHIVLQDGGELTDNVLSELEPKVWEDFQTKFLDASK